LLAQAGAALGFTPDEAVLIGDKTSDFEAAARWGCPAIGVRTGYAGSDGNCERDPDVWAEDLSAAVEGLLRQKENCLP
jgi:phosphoglycolate phosphatase-like HAD superfamily hydrolase